jgi:hypothetical protein
MLYHKELANARILQCSVSSVKSKGRIENAKAALLFNQTVYRQRKK